MYEWKWSRMTSSAWLFFSSVEWYGPVYIHGATLYRIGSPGEDAVMLESQSWTQRCLKKLSRVFPISVIIRSFIISGLMCYYLIRGLVASTSWRLSPVSRLAERLRTFKFLIAASSAGMRPLNIKQRRTRVKIFWPGLLNRMLQILICTVWCFMPRVHCIELETILVRLVRNWSTSW